MLALVAVTTAELAVVTNTIGLLRLPPPADPFVARNSVAMLSMAVAAAILVLVGALRSVLRARRGSPRSGALSSDAGPASHLVLVLAALSSVSTIAAVSLIVLIAAHSPLLPDPSAAPAP